ncbi:sensor histidine kinase [Methylobacterium sp. J-077]|uniref:sensor histidine kinase n=1 Tax=Methylobacterium sp. J-077 TaxID=2836656 RepID=UPI001FB894BE|nr:histidine kinase [Methylobacterium sp. J-077]MCJ2125278.1 histidine kinase [Methylobacterium sp. J-077]
MSLPAHLGLRLLAVALLCLAGAVVWSIWEARIGLGREAATSADRLSAQLARQPGLGSAGPTSMPAAAPQSAPAILMVLPGICADIHLGAEMPRRFCGDWDGLEAAPGWLRTALAWDAEAAPTIRAIVYRERTIGSVTAWPDPMAGAARIWDRVRLAGGLAVGLAVATALLNWFAVARLVAPAGRIVQGLDDLDGVRIRSPLPRFAAAEFDRIAVACNGLADRLVRAEAERADLMQRLVTVQEEERQAIARDLHDAFGQCLAAAGARAAAIELAAPPEREDLREDARGIEAIVATMRESLRGALSRLELPDLAEVGLVDALRGLVADWRAQLRAGPALHLDVTGDLADLPTDASASLYRVAQELLTNALRHGRPSRIFLRLDRAEAGVRTVTLTLDDDGGGDVARTASAAGRGLVGIRARLAALGGSLSLTGTESGIRAFATVPTAG